MKIEGCTISALSEWMPYTYVSIAKGVQNLEDLSLVTSKKEPDGTKVIAFVKSGRELWEMAKPFMTSPIKRTVFCDAVKQSEASKRIIVTHHLPSFQLSSPEFKGSRINGAFVSDEDDFIEECGAQYWIYGHSHRNIDKQIGRTRFVSNQLGVCLFW